MDSLRIGVLGCSSFARRAMLPALADVEGLRLAAVASRTAARAEEFAWQFACEPVEGYANLLARPDVDVVYVPLPTGLHEEWVGAAIEAGKHLLVEKSFAPDRAAAERLVEAARVRGRLVLENFQFVHHRQHRWVMETLNSGVLGRVRLVRATFGFPPLPPDNFRYRADLGGGALLDLGAYMVKITRLLLGDDLVLDAATRRMNPDAGVDWYGEAQYHNGAGQVAQVAYGFDYFYQCRYEVLGTTGKLSVERAFTPPPGFSPVVHIDRPGERRSLTLPPDNHYANMWKHFRDRVRTGGPHEAEWSELLQQADRLEELRTRARPS